MGDFYYSFSWGEAEWRLRLGQRLDKEGAQAFYFLFFFGLKVEDAQENSSNWGRGAKTEDK